MELSPPSSDAASPVPSLAQDSPLSAAEDPAESRFPPVTLCAEPLAFDDSNPFDTRLPSPRSRTYSAASSVSSFHSSSRSSYLDAGSPDDSACTSHPSFDSSYTALSLEPTGFGLLVEQPGVGQLSVHWDQLVQFLVDHDPEHFVEEDWDAYGNRIKVPLELVVFGPGTYRQVVERNVKILPSDTTSRVNDFLRAQYCVATCSFRFDGKRPSVIRQHVVSCKQRMRLVPGSDPLKRLCQLQLEAQQYTRTAYSPQGVDGRTTSRIRPAPPGIALE
ncbi:uncharacterized protein JCM15063_004802 [Sporobolomyces koalae]|uniref:uncharacterized protein n=1 Tax=Sporobolomyces koalae TaxID=500713 RepID=UPI00316E4C2C